MLTALGRSLDFVRHVPAAQILARLRLLAQRRAERLAQPSLGGFAIAPACDPPKPLFPPRSAQMHRGETGWRYHALGHAAEFGPDIAWDRHGPPGRDQLWRMTLHYMEYLEALGDSNLEALILQWIAANPPYRGGADGYSWNAYALSLRVVVWMQQLAARRARLSPALLAGAHRSLAEQLDYLDRHLELDIGGNHLIKNIKALLWGGAYFTGPRARRWQARGLRLLKRELPRQMLADGMHYERSPSYHCQITADLIEIAGVLPDAPAVSLGAVGPAVERALHVAATLSHPDGRIAQFSDAGLTMAYTARECATAAGAEVGKGPPTSAFALPEAGYFGLRTARHYFIADAGPIAPDTLPAHGHADIGSFEWSLGGRRMIVDQGVFQYLAGDLRQRSRSAAFHNTLAPEKMDQAEFFGAFRSAFRARIVERDYQEEDGGFTLALAHDGFVRGGGPVHRRCFSVRDDGFTIDDRLDRPVAAPAHVTMLLHPGVDAIAEPAPGGSQILLSHAKGRARLIASRRVSIEPAVWWPDIGVEHATVRLRMTIPAGERHGRTTITILDSAT